MTLRQTLQLSLNDVEHPIGRWTHVAIASLVLVSSIIFVIETYPVDPEVRVVLDTGNKAILMTFSIEYCLRLWVAKRKWHYIFSLYSLIDLAAIVPFFLGALDVSFLLVFRWLRILRLIRFIQGRTILGYWTTEDAVIFARILFTLFSIVFIYAGLIYQVEHPTNPNAFGTFLDAMYFAVATMTTVGFGDITPISEGGRLLTILMIWTGIALIPWQIGDLVRRLVKTINKVEIPCPGCGLTFHDADAQFCRACGTSLTASSVYESFPPSDNGQISPNPSVPNSTLE